MQFDPNSMTIDTQMSVNQNALVILVTGKLKVRDAAITNQILNRKIFNHFRLLQLIMVQLAGQENPLQFSQLFQLVATGPGAYYLNNDMFRLVYN